MRILITGASGFYGPYLIKELLLQGHQVFGIGFRRNQDWLREVLGEDFFSEDFQFAEIDITDHYAISKYIKQLEPEFVHHLAAQANIPTSKENPISTFRTNIEGTFNVLASCRGFECRVHLASSSDVYGPVKPVEQPIQETQLLQPLNPYGISKVAMEMIGRMGHQNQSEFLKNVIVTRLFTSFGPGQSTDSAISNFAWQCARIKIGKQDPIIHCGNIENVRNFIDVRDVCAAYRHLYSIEGTKSFDDLIFNICGADTISLRSIIERLIDISGLHSSEVKIDSSSRRSSDITRQVGDCFKFCDATKWTQKIPLEDSLRDVFDYWYEREERIALH